MVGPSGPEQCEYYFDIEEWEQNNDEDCHLDPVDDAEILTVRDGSVVWECPHQPVDGNKRCVFHSGSGDDSPDGDAAAEFQAIVNGEQPTTGESERIPPRFIGAQFEEFDIVCDELGDGARIDLRHAQVDRLQWDINSVVSPIDARGITVEYQADCRQATFKGGAGFGDATFENQAGFWDATFEGKARFGDATFENQAGFGDATFENQADFWDATFENQANFRGATFEETARFGDTTFEGGARFGRATFEGGARFGDTTFEGKARFGGATFEGKARFGDATFEGEADFVVATFEETARFGVATFEGEADFVGATFEGEAGFVVATFEEAARFNNVIFLGSEVSFSRAAFAEDVSFMVDLSDITSAPPFAQSTDFSHATVQGTLDLRIVDADENVIGEDLATFGGEVDFSDATIRDARLDGVSFAHKHTPGEDGPDVTFADADLTDASLRAADFTGVDLSNADLTNTTCRSADFTDANLEGTIFSRANLYEGDFTNARLYGALFGDARISDGTTFIDSGKWRTWLPRIRTGMQTVLDDPRTDPTSESHPDAEDSIDPRSRAASIYAQLETLARENARSQTASTCFRWRKDMERGRYWNTDGPWWDRQWLRWGLAKLTNVFSRYADSPWRVVAWSGLVILGSTLLMYFGTKGIRRAPDADPITKLPKLLYFSVVTFTTLGYGDFQPAGAWAQRIASVESLVGALLVALLVAVLGRRATR